MIEIFLAIFLGVMFGTITGLIPGVHVNLISTILVGLSGWFLGFTEPILLGIFIISMAVTHSFLDSVPSIFLGAPDPDMALAVLPGHRMLLEGKGYEAVRLTVIGSLFSIIIAVLLIYPLIKVIGFIFPYLQKVLPYILILVVLVLILKENKKSWAFILFFFAGVLGLGVFGLKMENPLLPMLSGLFGVSGLILSISNNIKLPKQRITKSKVGKGKVAKALGSSVLAAGMTALLPGIGAAQAAIAASSIAGNIGNRAFLILMGGINTVNFILSFVSLYVLGKARNGAIVAVKQIVIEFSLNDLLLFVGSALVVAGVASVLALLFARVMSKVVGRVKYKLLCYSVISLVVVLVFVFSGFLGLFVLFVSSMLGMIPPLVGVGRNHMMGCLILPVILFFLL